ncbi:MAG: hypothetical protein H6650_18610 [Ardenticatenales bacterium]|nr:hypothetical protein [Ardenticatenales bacterium]
MKSILGLFVCFVCLFLFAAPASANEGCQETVVVTNVGDSGPGSLRDALIQVCLGGEVAFDVPVPSAIVLTSGPLVVSYEMNINGPGADNLTVDGFDADRVFYIAGDNVTLRGLTVRRGYDDSTGGAGIYNIGQNVTLENMVVTDNAGTLAGGGVRNSGSMTISNSQIENNTVLVGSGGGIANTGTLTLAGSRVRNNFSGAEGGGIANYSLLIMTVSELTGNTADEKGGGIYNYATGVALFGSASLSNNQSLNSSGGFAFNEGLLVVRKSAIAGNIALNKGAALRNYGDGGRMILHEARIVQNTSVNYNIIQNDGNQLIISRSLIAHNTSAGYTIFNGTPGFAAEMLIENSTISGNETTPGQAVMKLDSGSHASFQFSTFVDNQTSGNIVTGGGSTVEFLATILKNPAFDCTGSGYQSAGYNIGSDSSCLLYAPTDLPNTDALLGPLFNYGGNTLTHKPLPGSPALDGGPTTCVDTDQRGVSRPQGNSCDIGAMEVVN